MQAAAGLAARIWSKNTGWMLVRNTIVSTAVFLLGLAVLWLLVDYGGMTPVPAAAVGFIVANSLHYLLGRTWIFRGTDRAVVPGYAFFLTNGLIGLGITLVLFDAFLRFTWLHYLVARVIVSVVAGLVMFLLNGILNFRRI